MNMMPDIYVIWIMNMHYEFCKILQSNLGIYLPSLPCFLYVIVLWYYWLDDLKGLQFVHKP